jgi:hypothetical protein
MAFLLDRSRCVRFQPAFVTNHILDILLHALADLLAKLRL